MEVGNRGETHGTILSQIKQTDFEKRISYVLGSCDRASWAKYEDRKTNKMQQLDVYY